MEIAVYTDEMSVKPNQISQYQSTRETKQQAGWAKGMQTQLH